ncbi:hypothetical protein [Butyrivibrio sp. WCD3002]|uniref:hypothetical protein n=1 Tax=Butyrivibrio sp. WCD3002 TaxID=1280676 RepID=UPI00047B63C3|nr:hypothetical protein [Butyrivibrio sp. WCD3002]
MDNTNNISGYRSVYMAFGVYKVGSANQQQTKSAEISEAPAFLTALNVASGKSAGDESLPEITNANITPHGLAKPDNSDATLSYTRIITAKVPDSISSALSNWDKDSGKIIEDGDSDSESKVAASSSLDSESKAAIPAGSEFDINDGSQELQITIKVTNGTRIYTASGVDKDGNAFSKEIDPYSVDPTDTDYAGFATLCAYIRDTEGLADNAMKAVRDAAPADITEKGNYLYMVGFSAEGNSNLSGAKKLFEQLENFFERLMGIGSMSSSSETSDQKAVAVRSDSSESSASSGGSFHSRVLEELHELIEQMLQKMLNEIMGIDDADEKASIAAESEIATDETGSADSSEIEESLGIENAVEL